MSDAKGDLGRDFLVAKAKHLRDQLTAATERAEKAELERDEALREAATHLEESAVQFKRPADRAMIVLAAHYVRALATKGGTT